MRAGILMLVALARTLLKALVRGYRGLRPMLLARRQRLRELLPLLIRGGLAAAVFAGALLLMVGDMSDLRGVRAIEVDLQVVSAGDQHGYVLFVVGVAVLLLGWFAVVQRSRMAMALIAAAGALAGGIVLLVDLPSLGSTAPIDTLYASTRAWTGSAVYLELVAAVLLITSGVLQLRLAPPGRPRVKPAPAAGQLQ